MTEADEKTEMSTLLAVPIALKRRVEAQADFDRRPYKKEILTALEEWCDMRERKQVWRGKSAGD